MPRLSRHAFFLLAILSIELLPVLCLAETRAVIAVNEDILPDYYRFLQEREPQNIQNYSGAGARRDVIELVLLQQALRLGGFKEPVDLAAEQSYSRSMRGITEGRYITSAGLAWEEDIASYPDAFYVSRPLVKNGEFIVGVYTSAHNKVALSAQNLPAITRLTSVTSSQWKTDVKTLKHLGIDKIIYSPSWVNIARMLDANRADITLAPFQLTPDMSITVGTVKLLPIKNVKVALAGSRHWPVSRKHPQGKDFYDALERGISLMEARGTILKAYRECGFFHPDVAGWPLLEP